MNKRLIRVSVQVGGQMVIYSSEDGMNISVSGTKYASPTKNECSITLMNIKEDTRNQLLTNKSGIVSVEVGREDSGYFLLFQGDIVEVTTTSPPDVALTIHANTAANASYKIVSKAYTPSAMLSTIAQGVASDMGLTLDFQAKDKKITNFYHNGPMSSQIQKLEETGGITVYVDDGKLMVQDSKAALKGRIKILNLESGMVGLPNITTDGQGTVGVEVAYVIDGESVLGGLLRIDSKFNPSSNGDYSIQQLGFQASSHGDDFVYLVQGVRI